MKAGEERLVTLEVVPPRPGATAQVQVIQERIDAKQRFVVTGGLTLQLSPGSDPAVEDRKVVEKGHVGAAESR
jgi:hypothetical protein